MLVIWLLSCIGSEAQPECTNNAQCEGLCVDEKCVVADCISSVDCPLQEFCQEGECLGGCEQEADCFAGQVCEDSECVDGGCRLAQLDCNYAEDCIDSVCEPSTFPLCSPCGFEEWQDTPNGEQECILYNFSLRLKLLKNQLIYYFQF